MVNARTNESAGTPVDIAACEQLDASPLGTASRALGEELTQPLDLTAHMPSGQGKRPSAEASRESAVGCRPPEVCSTVKGGFPSSKRWEVGYMVECHERDPEDAAVWAAAKE